MTIDNGMSAPESFEDLEQKVRAWADSKGIPENSTAQKQLKLTLEETAETITEMELQKYDIGEHYKVYMEFGDILVTVINALYLYSPKVTAAECLESAYRKINKRQGKMINGKFTKDEA